MAKYRKKPVVIEAWDWLGGGFQTDAPRWLRDYKAADGRQVTERQDGTLLIPTLEGDHTASIGDWIIRGVKGEVYPCKPDIFDATYDRVEAE